MVRLKERTVDIEDIVNKLEPQQKLTTQNLRALIKTVVPEAVETVKHQTITYKLNKVDFVWILPYQGHVDLEFAMGASLASVLLKSRGTAEKSENLRHITVGNFDKLKPELERLLKAAAQVGFEHCPTSS
jgi:hypothetical protein